MGSVESQRSCGVGRGAEEDAALHGGDCSRCVVTPTVRFRVGEDNGGSYFEYERFADRMVEEHADVAQLVEQLIRNQ